MTRPCRARGRNVHPAGGVLPAIDDVAGVAVVSVPARVVKSLPRGNPSDVVMHQGCLRIVRYGCLSFPPWRSMHRGLVVLACSSTGLLRGYRAHARRRALGLLHSSLLDERLCLAAQVAT